MALMNTLFSPDGTAIGYRMQGEGPALILVDGALTVHSSGSGVLGISADDPEPQIAARALLGLWHVQAGSLRKYLDGSLAPTRIHELVTADVRRAARGRPSAWFVGVSAWGCRDVRAARGLMHRGQLVRLRPKEPGSVIVRIAT